MFCVQCSMLDVRYTIFDASMNFKRAKKGALLRHEKGKSAFQEFELQVREAPKTLVEGDDPEGSIQCHCGQQGIVAVVAVKRKAFAKGEPTLAAACCPGSRLDAWTLPEDAEKAGSFRHA